MKLINKKEQVTPVLIKSLVELFSHEYWTDKRTIDDVKHLLEHSYSFVMIVDEEEQEVLGFGRTLSDGYHAMMIYDVIVKNEYRKQGIGQKIVQTILDDAKKIEIIDLLCKDYNLQFYEKIGFQKEQTLNVMRIKQDLK